jgi:arsenate reductase
VFDFYKQGRMYSYVITVCDESNGERCPLFPGITQKIAWSFDDPSALTGSEEEKLNAIRTIRDKIKIKIQEFIKEI